MAELVAKIESEIGNKGAIPFARFMELALYCPVYGYYEKEGDIIGRRGDYYTSVSVGKVFGQLLSCQCNEWLKADGEGAGRLLLVEAGAHRGDLAGDILEWFQTKRPDVFHGLEYWIIEPSTRQRTRQQETLSRFGDKAHWIDDFSALKNRKAGEPREAAFWIIFANELLDAMPVHRLGWDAVRRVWFEWGVTVRDGEFEWVRMPGEEPAKTETGPQQILQNLLEELGAGSRETVERLLSVLPDGFCIEISPAAHRWWHDAAESLPRGKLVAIDYGRRFEEQIVPERAQGTLRAFRGHRQARNILAVPGQQDITADVNFTLIERTGKMAGLKTELFVSQAKFLTDIGKRIWEGSVSGAWTAECNREFQTLTHPEHLGSRFSVLVQGR